MATLTLTSATGADTTTKVLTYSGQDANKIFQLWTKYVWNMPAPTPPPPTHQDFTNWCGDFLANQFQSWNSREGTQVVEPPPIGIT